MYEHRDVRPVAAVRPAAPAYQPPSVASAAGEPVAETSEDGTPEQARRIVLKEWYEKVEKWMKFKQFLETRRRVFAGERLFDCSAKQLEKQELLGPLAFNVYQSSLTALPAVVVLKAWALLFPQAGPPTAAADAATASDTEWSRAFAELLPEVTRIAQTVNVPFGLLVLSVVAGWASFHRGDGTKEKRARARRAFLYFDGAYGLIPQTAWASAVTLALATATGELTLPASLSDAAWWAPVLGLGQWVLAAAMIIVTAGIAEGVFAVNGYSVNPARTLGSAPTDIAIGKAGVRRWMLHAPRAKMYFSLALLAPVTIVVASATVYMLVAALAALCALIVVATRHLLA